VRGCRREEGAQTRLEEGRCWRLEGEEFVVTRLEVLPRLARVDGEGGAAVAPVAHADEPAHDDGWKRACAAREGMRERDGGDRGTSARKR